jgi:hypothetical protein
MSIKPHHPWTTSSLLLLARQPWTHLLAVLLARQPWTHLLSVLLARQPWLLGRVEWHRRNPDCWEVPRHPRGRDRISSSSYFAAAFSGRHCDSNWYEGNLLPLGDGNTRPRFAEPAPALFGFDETIDGFCWDHTPRWWNDDQGGYDHAKQCVLKNLNILSLYGFSTPYNLCRNLEWQLCAAMGKLPGQRSRTILFSLPPNQLDTNPHGRKPFGPTVHTVPSLPRYSVPTAY